MKRKEYLNLVKDLIPDIKNLASEYYHRTKRPLGATGELAEYEAIRLLPDLEPCNVREKSHDAIRKINIDGKEVVQKIQIKGRVVTNTKKLPKPGAIKKGYDSVAFVLFKTSFEVLIILEATQESIEPALDKGGSKARNVRRQLSMSKFKSLALQIYPKI